MGLSKVNVVIGAAACLFGIVTGQAAFGQTERLNCDGVDRECMVSEAPVPGVRIVREKNFYLRPAYYLSSNLYTTLAGNRETLNQFVAFDFQIPPGGGPQPHTHHNEWETFFVSEGTVTFTIGVTPTAPYSFVTKDVSAGQVVYGSQGPVHGFINNSGKPARIYSFAMPAGLDEFFHNSGTSVWNYYAPIPPIGFDEIVRTAFWAGQRGDALYPANTPAPTVPAGTPDHQISDINGTNVITGGKRPTKTGPFGEQRVVLLTPQEVGSITGATAFCFPPIPPAAPGTLPPFGGTVEYSYIPLGASPGFPPDYISPNTETFMTLGGSNLSMRFTSPATPVSAPRTVIVKLEPRTFVQIAPGVPFSIANIGTVSFAKNPPAAETLAVSVISPVCPVVPPPAD